ncbi:LTA synthase family protein [Phocaeicola plebeius]|jgi:phosphoglycerol transferase MdoB-like AlkP superfamily enzyme|uniref:LTA synthase family protein n=1 Tax=Phocaeicola plebeius TaxID=310297 RepID=UPI0026EEC8AA|nr:LTA synthase family protein [Phocaeicola plebeius]
MIKKELFSNVLTLAWNLLLVYVCYTLCRLAFLFVNWDTFSGNLSWGYTISLLGAGIIFDTTAILYSNALFILLFLLPLHWKETPSFYKGVRWIFTIVNTFFLITNLIDCVYFRFSGRRTTMTVFQEFKNEGEGNLASIFLDEFISYWYLVVFAALLSYAIYKLYRSPQNFPVKQKLSYYVVQLVTLLIAVPFTVFGMRGGMTTATRPITLSNANQYVRRPLDAGLVLNTPFSLFRTLGKTTFVTPNYLPDSEAVAVYSPIHTPTDSVAFRPMNVVVIIWEGFSKQHVGSLNPQLENGTYKGYTPFIDSLLTRSLTFQYSYSNGRKSIDGMPSVLSSIPSFVEPFFLTPSALNDVSSVAGELTKYKGYTSAFFHGAMNGSMGFQAFARSVGFQKYFGRTEYNEDPNYNGDADFDGTWAIWDEEFLQFYCDRMSEMKEPFVTSVFTASSHGPFVLPERYKGKFPVGEDPFSELIGYSDYAIGRFFEKAEKQPWFKNTLFVITADHTSGNYYPDYVTDLGYYKVPVIFYAPGMPDLKGLDTEKIVEQIDIMPTVLGILGYDRPYVGFGQDALHTPASEKFAVNYIHASGIYQFLKGDYLIQFDGEKVIHAYRFRTDVLMKDDVKDSMPQEVRKEMETQLKSIIQQYMQRMNNNELVYRE